MKPLTKIIIVLLVIVFGSLAVKFFFQSSPEEAEYLELPIGSPNVPHEQGGIIPTTVGFSPKDVLPFNSLLTHSPDVLFASALDSVYMDVYGIFPCRLDEEDSSVVMFTAKTTETSQGASYEPAKTAIATWEPHMFDDIGAFIFPDTVLPSSSGLVDFVDIPGTEYKSGAVYLSGQKQFIYSGWRLNYVFYASSQECLVEAMDLVYEYH